MIIRIGYLGYGIVYLHDDDDDKNDDNDTLCLH
jgi:hypothetical protein